MDEKVHTWLGSRKGRLEGLLSKKGERNAAEYKEGSDGEGETKGEKNGRCLKSHWIVIYILKTSDLDLNTVKGSYQNF